MEKNNKQIKNLLYKKQGALKATYLFNYFIYINPKGIIVSATFTNPAIFAPFK